jgi:hypothetical protein
MTLQASGAISLGDIQTEFGGSNPIGLNEYYRNGPYVSGTQEIVGTASNVSYTRSLNGTTGWDGGGVFWRYYENGNGILPTQINNAAWFYAHRFWTDQAWTSGTGWCDSTFTLDQAGEYTVKEIGYNTGATRSTTVYVDGQQIAQFGNGGSHTFTLSGPATIRIYASMNTIGNYNAHEIRVTSSTGDNRDLSTGANEEIPQSGPIAISNFYNRTSEYYVDYTAAEISDYSTSVTWGDRTWIGVTETYTGSWPFHGYCLTGVDQILYYRAFEKGPVDLRFTNKYSGTYRFTVSNSTAYGSIGNTTQKIYQDGVLKGTNVCSFGGSSTLDVYLEVGTEIRITSESDNGHYYNVQAGSMTVAPSQGDGLRTFTS